METYGDSSEWPYNYFIMGAKDKKVDIVQFAPKLRSEGGKFDSEMLGGLKESGITINM